MEKYIGINDTTTTWQEKKMEINNSVIIDKIYKKLFPTLKAVIRPQTGDDEKVSLYQQLDVKHGIDTHLILRNGSPLTIQEKVLQHSKKIYDHLTWEYSNNPNIEILANKCYSNEKGEWFKGLAQLLFFGYNNADGTVIDRWYLINVATFRMIMNLEFTTPLGCSKMNYNHYPAKASFLCFDWKFIKEHFQSAIVFQGGVDGNGEVEITKSL